MSTTQIDMRATGGLDDSQYHTMLIGAQFRDLLKLTVVTHNVGAVQVYLNRDEVIKMNEGLTRTLEAWRARD
jgi:hypothetical protein